MISLPRILTLNGSELVMQPAPQTERLRTSFIDPKVGERLAYVQIGFASSHERDLSRATSPYIHAAVA